jgi:hypothetical protein
MHLRDCGPKPIRDFENKEDELFARVNSFVASHGGEVDPTSSIRMDLALDQYPARIVTARCVKLPGDIVAATASPADTRSVAAHCRVQS